MSDETPVERRLRELGDRLREHGGNDVLRGREAIRLLRLGLANLDSPYTENTMDTSERLIAESRALLARCTEGPR